MKKKIDTRTYSKIQEKIICSLELDEVITSVLKEVPLIMKAEASAVLLFDSFTNKLKCHFLEEDDKVSSFYLSPDQGYGGWVYQHKKPIILNNPSFKKNNEKHIGMSSDIKSVIASPLDSGEDILGVIEIFNKKKGFFTDDDLSLLTFISDDITKAISSAREFKEISEGFTRTVEVLSESNDSRCEFTKGHSKRVADLTILTAKKFGYPFERIRGLHYAALLHDIGKIRIKNSIITKKGFLSDQEYKVMKMHPGYSADIISKIGYLNDMVPAVRYHHERHDGLGYPEGLKGDDIPLEARIISLADAFDAMTSERAYREKFSYEKAVTEINRCSGSQFDPELVEVFIGVLQSN